MKYIVYFILFILIITNPVIAQTLELTNFKNNNDYLENNCLRELTYAENQIFQKNMRNESILSRLEKLELILFGAIQTGETAYRIGKVYRSCKNIYEGGYGLHYLTGNNYPYIKNYRPYVSPHSINHPYYKRNYYPHEGITKLPINALPDNYSVGTTVRILKD